MMEQQSPAVFFNKNIDCDQLNFDVYHSPDLTLEMFTDKQNNNKDFKSGESLIKKSIQKLPRNKRTYKNISNELRRELLDSVIDKGEKIKQAAQRLNINYSSAKSICQIYKREGRSEKMFLKRKNSPFHSLKKFQKTQIKPGTCVSGDSLMMTRESTLDMQQKQNNIRNYEVGNKDFLDGSPYKFGDKNTMIAKDKISINQEQSTILNCYTMQQQQISSKPVNTSSLVSKYLTHEKLGLPVAGGSETNFIYSNTMVSSLHNAPPISIGKQASSGLQINKSNFLQMEESKIPEKIISIKEQSYHDGFCFRLSNQNFQLFQNITYPLPQLVNISDKFNQIKPKDPVFCMIPCYSTIPFRPIYQDFNSNPTARMFHQPNFQPPNNPT